MLPGTLSATAISVPLQTYTPAHTLGSAATSAPSHVASNALLPFGYWYGHAETKRNPLLMDRLIRNLGENIWDRWDSDMQGGYFCSPLLCCFRPDATIQLEPSKSHPQKKQLLSTSLFLVKLTTLACRPPSF